MLRYTRAVLYQCASGDVRSCSTKNVDQSDHIYAPLVDSVVGERKRSMRRTLSLVTFDRALTNLCHVNDVSLEQESNLCPQR